MMKVLRDAIAKVEALPEEAQDRIARDLIYYLDKLDALRAEVEIGIRQIDAGEGREVDIEEVIRQARKEHGQEGLTYRLGAESPARRGRNLEVSRKSIVA